MAHYRGTVGWFNHARGFGFVKAENGSEILCRYSAIQNGGYQSLDEGESVEFDIEQGEKGPEAAKVRVLGKRWTPVCRLLG